MQDHPYKLINVGSIASRKPLVDVTVYCTSKYGCLALTHCGAWGWPSTTSPSTATPRRRGDAALGTARQGPRRDRLQGAEGQAYDDIAATPADQARVLSRRHHRHGVVPRSDDSDYMTGQMIHIDGGWVIEVRPAALPISPKMNGCAGAAPERRPMSRA
jgi:NAD(P)-dependent dehydrogenase (short-subunit alcohol dehydrogenase family)